MEKATMQTLNTQSNQRPTRTLLTGNRIAAASVLGMAFAAMGIGLTGCGNGIADPAGSLSLAGASTGIHGVMHGGQQPISGATVTLYAVGTTGLKSASTAVTGATTTTASNGEFTLPAYTCGSATMVYLVASGGSSNGGTNTNSAISLIAPLGQCSTVLANAANIYVQMNELTTVAAVYTLAPFMSDYLHVGAASTGFTVTGLTNAVANFNNLVNIATGTVGGASLPAGATLPTAELNTLADIIAACINSATSTSGQCPMLLTATSATNTVGAALAIAANPASTTYTAFATSNSLVSAQSPFQPTLGSNPSDFSIAIKYVAGGALSGPSAIAIDASGNAWVTNGGGTGLVELTHTGAPTTYTGPVGAQGVAIDKSGNVWVANTTQNTVIEYVAGSPTSYSVGGLNGPVAIAFDSLNNAWIANLVGNSVTVLSSSGNAVLTGVNPSSAISQPTGIALDTTGNVYISNNGGGDVVKLTHSGALATGSPFTDSTLQGSLGVALDSSNNVYALGSTTGTFSAAAVSQFSSTGTAASYSPFASPSATVPYQGIAVAGTNQVLVTDTATAGHLTSLNLSTSTSVTYGSLNAPIGVAIDPSGDVWTANSGDNTVSEFIGLTTPVTTPIAANVGP